MPYLRPSFGFLKGQKWGGRGAPASGSLAGIQQLQKGTLLLIQLSWAEDGGLLAMGRGCKCGLGSYLLPGAKLTLAGTNPWQSSVDWKQYLACRLRAPLR